jgi:hypothetical protein
VIVQPTAVARSNVNGWSGEINQRIIGVLQTKSINPTKSTSMDSDSARPTVNGVFCRGHLRGNWIRV